MTTGVIHAIVNPRSAGGRTARVWPEIEAAMRERLGPITVAFTDAPLAASRLTAEALKAGARLIVAVGGDGTVNECVNGFFEDGQKIAPRAALGLMMSGTGGDFRRSLNLSGTVPGYLDALCHGTDRPVDVGKVSYTADDGKPATRYFINIASFGVSGAVVRAVNRAVVTKWLGGRFAFFWNSVITSLTYRARPVHLTVDGWERTLRVHVVAVANGRFFGGGMKIAPEADLGDGRFDVVTIERLTTWEILTQPRRLYRGDHVGHPKVQVLRGARIDADPEGDADGILLDMDGEAPGRLPASFEVLPHGLLVRC